MVDYALHFYNNYTLFFYILIIIAVILEWPITVLTLSLFASRIWLSFIFIYIFAFFWEFFWDLLHYFIGRFFKKNFFEDKNFIIFEKFEKKLEHHWLFDKLIVVKYTPPITSIGLIYLWFQKTNIKDFMKNVMILALLDSVLITFVWYNFWKFLIDKNDFKYIIIGMMLSFLIIFILFKLITSYFVKKVLDEKK